MILEFYVTPSHGLPFHSLGIFLTSTTSASFLINSAVTSFNLVVGDPDDDGAGDVGVGDVSAGDVGDDYSDGDNDDNDADADFDENSLGCINDQS